MRRAYLTQLSECLFHRYFAFLLLLESVNESILVLDRKVCRRRILLAGVFFCSAPLVIFDLLRDCRYKLLKPRRSFSLSRDLQWKLGLR